MATASTGPGLAALSRDQLERRINEARATIYQLSGWPSIHRPAIDELLDQIDLARRELERRWPRETDAADTTTGAVTGAASGRRSVAVRGRGAGPALVSESFPTGRVAPETGLLPVRCPRCQGTTVGTEEVLTATALVSGYDPQLGEFEYAETIVDYDSSETQQAEDGRTIMFCRDCCRHFLFGTKVDPR